MKTVREAATMLGYDESHVRRLCIAGKLKGRKMGWMWVISEKSIKKCLLTSAPKMVRYKEECRKQ